MARINIEASAALAEWIDLCRTEPELYERLAYRALAYLPMPKKRARPKQFGFAVLAAPSSAASLIQAVRASNVDKLARERALVEQHASRIFANALINVGWRNGPIEDVHAGVSCKLPLDRRRVTEEEEARVLGTTVHAMAAGMAVVRELRDERGRPWPEQVLPYRLMPMITPLGWSLTEVSREVRL